MKSKSVINTLSISPKLFWINSISLSYLASKLHCSILFRISILMSTSWSTIHWGLPIISESISSACCECYFLIWFSICKNERVSSSSSLLDMTLMSPTFCESLLIFWFLTSSTAYHCEPSLVMILVFGEKSLKLFCAPLDWI